MPPKDESMRIIVEQHKASDIAINASHVFCCPNNNDHSNAILINRKVIPQISGLACLALSFHNSDPARNPGTNIACSMFKNLLAMKYDDSNAKLARMEDKNRVFGSV